MLRILTLCSLAILSSATLAGEIGSVEGFYLESRTCQVYTGPCFANAEFGLTGNDAIMAWHIERGSYAGTDLANRSVVVVIHADQTLASAGIADAKTVKSVIFVDAQADSAQREALVGFAKTQTGKAGSAVVRVTALSISMTLDRTTLVGRLQAGDVVTMVTRKARQGDCICTNEVAYYPPLAAMTNFVPGVATEAKFSGRGLGTHWSVPDSRSVYMGLFSF